MTTHDALGALRDRTDQYQAQSQLFATFRALIHDIGEELRSKQSKPNPVEAVGEDQFRWKFAGVQYVFVHEVSFSHSGPRSDVTVFKIDPLDPAKHHETPIRLRFDTEGYILESSGELKLQMHGIQKRTFSVADKSDLRAWLAERLAGYRGQG